MASATMEAAMPMSIAEIAARAQDFEYNPYIRLRVWLRTAELLLREAEIYEDEGNIQQAYMLLMRFVTLVAEKLSAHPDSKDPANRRALKSMIKCIPDAVDRLEILKPRIVARYEAWQTDNEGRDKAAAGLWDGRGFASKRYAETDPAIAGRAKTLEASEHSGLAIKLAHKEIRRRDDVRRITRRDSERDQVRYEGGDDGVDLQRRMEDTRRKMDSRDKDTEEGARKKLTKLHPSASEPSSSTPRSSEYKYPLISKSKPFTYEEMTAQSERNFGRESAPPIPSKQLIRTGIPFESSAPARPAKLLEEEPPSSTPSPVDDPSAYTFKPSAYLENGSPLRTLFLPNMLRESFLSIARPNTEANLETCGILCGTLISNALFISRLVIPEQESTSDTCETTNEGALFDYCDKEDLMVLGWIHTHPSQTCFMSSRDLHTHCGYQVMMPESIAIVCAPSKSPSWGVFRMTDPPGMKSVLNCRQTGLFHPHPETDIYTDAMRPGHVFETPGMEFKVVDLRPRQR
ncbi:hypothetical protein V493_03453 [Pseudogymnoascus sp. VKM F-4281 (FW-2241)]|nr:hypothetical protein V493_03453 [Pseudogymnoascus sp. VKM F-4281 (FW-2241)]